MQDINQAFLEHLDYVIDLYESPGGKSPYQNMGILSSAAMAAIERVAGPTSPYARQACQKVEGAYGPGTHKHVEYLLGIVRTLRQDVASGRLNTLTELIHGEIFGDFLEMADYLLGEGYKDAAAVIAGGVLEIHLRQLCIKHGIDVEIKTATEVKPKKADRLNSDLAGVGVYSKLDQKHVTAWLDLRNKAAHAKYDEYSKEQVALLVQSIRDFVSRNPA